MLLVLPVLRAGASCRCRLRLGPHPTHMNTSSTLERPPRLRACECVCMPSPHVYYGTEPPLYTEGAMTSQHATRASTQERYNLCQ